MKKLISLIGAGAMLLSLATPALALYPKPKPVEKNVAIIKGNDVTAYANTGYNVQSNSASGVMLSGVNVGGSQTQKTGPASADASSTIIANKEVGCSACSLTASENLAVVRNNDVYADANTGLNSQGNSASNVMLSQVNVGGSQTQTTGAANATATGVVVVNTQMSWGYMPW